jgi:hypothetical protein
MKERLVSESTAGGVDDHRMRQRQLVRAGGAKRCRLAVARRDFVADKNREHVGARANTGTDLRAMIKPSPVSRSGN